MFICEIWFKQWYFPQFSKSDMWKEGPFDFEITRVDCTCISQFFFTVKGQERSFHFLYIVIFSLL